MLKYLESRRRVGIHLFHPSCLGREMRAQSLCLHMHIKVAPKAETVGGRAW